MTKEEIFKILKDGMIELFEFEEKDITLQTKVYEDLDIDSIDAIDLVDFMKKKTGYRLLPEDFQNIIILEDIVIAVQKKLEAEKNL